MLDCLCVGIAVADHVCPPISHLPAAGELILCERLDLTVGGCAANVAVDLAKLGVRVGVAARVGRDPFGAFLRGELERAGVATTHLEESPTAQTSGTLIVNVAGEDRRFIHTIGANAEFDAAALTPDVIAQTRLLYVGGFFVTPRLTADRVAELFRAARAGGVITVLDVVIPGPADYDAALRRVLPYTDVFLPNNDEARLMLGLDDPADQAAAILERGATTAVVTCGAAGAVAARGQERYRAGVHQVEFIDGTGSGDAFDAGFIYGLLEGADLPRCLEYGAALGASCVRAAGATTGVFTRGELQQFLSQSRSGKVVKRQQDA